MKDHELIEKLLPLDDGPGPAPPRDAAQLEGDVAAALVAAQLPAPTSPGGPSSGVGGPASGSTALWVGVSMVIAALGAGALWWSNQAPPSLPPPAVIPVEVESAENETPVNETLVNETPVDDAIEVEPEVDVAPTPVVRTRPTPSPDDLLARAGELRVERRYGDAMATYEQVIARAPSSRAAYVARISAAALALEPLHAPRRALALYREAAALDGDLDPQAEHGVSRALRALGDLEGERRALHALIEDHPSSPLAALARQRLEALDAPTENP